MAGIWDKVRLWEHYSVVSPFHLPAAPPSALPSVEFIISTRPMVLVCSSVPLPVAPKKPVAWHSSINTRELYLSARSQILLQMTIKSYTCSLVKAKASALNPDIHNYECSSNFAFFSLSIWATLRSKQKIQSEAISQSSWFVLKSNLLPLLDDALVNTYARGETFPSMLNTPSVAISRWRHDWVFCRQLSRSVTTKLHSLW